MRFIINHDLLAQVSADLFGRSDIYWVVGGAGAGAGKTTICRILAARQGIPLYDMDAHIYGTYHQRFSSERHPVNHAWATAPNGLDWLLSMSWEMFDNFNRAALPEYLDLLRSDIGGDALLIDGGVCNPAMLAQVLSASQIVCLAGPEQSSAAVWETDEERRAMKGFIYQLPDGSQKWCKFLEFDHHITTTILRESQENSIPICERSLTESVDEFADRVARTLNIARRRPQSSTP